MTPQQIIIYEWIKDHAPLTIQMTVRPDNIAPLENAIGEALASARAEGIREAAMALRPAVTIAARYDEDMNADDAITVDRAINYIISAIGGQK